MGPQATHLISHASAPGEFDFTFALDVTGVRFFGLAGILTLFFS